MRKVILFVTVLIISFSTGVYAKQDFTSYSPAFKDGDLALQAGLGLHPAGTYGDMVVPPLFVGVDWAHSIADLPLSFGGIFGYAHSEEKFSSFGYDWTFSYNYYIVGARAAYHADLGVKNLDSYAGLMLGYNFVSAKIEGDTFGDVSADGNYLLFGGYLGARYFFTDNLAAFCELGFGIGILSFGATFVL